MTRATAWTLVRRLVLVALVVLIVVNPAFGSTTTSARAADLQVLVVIDRTKSMDALDHDGLEPRIDGARADLKTFADALPGARFAVITFGALVRVEQPFTSDVTAFDTVVDTVRVERPFDGTGSLVDRPLDAMRVVLERAAQQQPDRRRVVILVSDGENTTGGSGQRSFAPLADLVQGGAVLGYGTEAGGRMRFSDDPSDVDDYLTDSETGKDAVSRIDEDNLRLIAQQLGVPYQHPDGPLRPGRAGLAPGRREHRLGRARADRPLADLALRARGAGPGAARAARRLAGAGRRTSFAGPALAGPALAGRACEGDPVTASTRGSSRAARRAVRNRLLVAGLIPLVLVLMFVLKVALMLGNASSGRSALEVGHPDEALTAFAANGTLNLLEPWVAPYDEGIARYALEDYAGAVARFTRALEDVPPEQECTVRINLALSQEALGDAAVEEGRGDEAAARFAEGTRVLVDGGCPFDPELGQDLADEQEQDEQPTQQERRQLAQAQQVDGRLREKLRTQENDAQAAKNDPQDQQPQDDQDEKDQPDPQEKELEDRNDAGQEERRDVEEFQDSEGAGPDYQW